MKPIPILALVLVVIVTINAFAHVAEANRPGDRLDANPTDSKPATTNDSMCAEYRRARLCTSCCEFFQKHVKTLPGFLKKCKCR